MPFAFSFSHELGRFTYSPYTRARNWAAALLRGFCNAAFGACNCFFRFVPFAPVVFAEFTCADQTGEAWFSSHLCVPIAS